MKDALPCSHWAEPIALMAFLVSFAVFALILLGSARLPTARLRRLEEFPLEKETLTPHEDPKR